MNDDERKSKRKNVHVGFGVDRVTLGQVFLPVLRIPQSESFRQCLISIESSLTIYEGWNFNSGNYLFTTDTK